VVSRGDDEDLWPTSSDAFAQSMWTEANGENAHGRLARTRQRSRQARSGLMMVV